MVHLFGKFWLFWRNIGYSHIFSRIRLSKEYEKNHSRIIVRYTQRGKAFGIPFLKDGFSDDEVNLIFFRELQQGEEGFIAAYLSKKLCLKTLKSSKSTQSEYIHFASTTVVTKNSADKWPFVLLFPKNPLFHIETRNWHFWFSVNSERHCSGILSLFKLEIKNYKTKRSNYWAQNSKFCSHMKKFQWICGITVCLQNTSTKGAIRSF